MRLHRHDEIVEAMAKCLQERNGFLYQPIAYHTDAAAALDAFLEEVVRLGVGKIVTVYGENLVLEMETEK
jgi:hypothetical protein